MSSELRSYVSGLLAVQDAAELVKLSTFTLYRLARAGRIGSIKVGRRLYFAEDDLLEYLKAQHRPARNGVPG